MSNIILESIENGIKKGPSRVVYPPARQQAVSFPSRKMSPNFKLPSKIELHACLNSLQSKFKSIVNELNKSHTKYAHSPPSLPEPSTSKMSYAH